jgi:hypothetical protein
MRRDAPWKRLAAELAEHGLESRYLARVQARVDPEQELTALQQEIAGEIARALGRTEERLNLAMAELELCGARLARLRVGGETGAALQDAIEAFNQQRREAEHRLRDLVIHREAAGFRRNQAVYEEHPLPPPER